MGREADMVEKWKYGDSWEKFSINEFEIWSAGENKMLCADIAKVTEEDMSVLLYDQKVDMVYVDPPWNQSNISSFRTKAGIKERQDFETFINILLLKIFRHCRLVGYIETGKQNISMLMDKLKTYTNEILEYDVTYYGNKPSKIIRFKIGRALLKDVNLNGFDDEDTPYVAMRNEMPTSVIDFCMGRGLTARTAFSLGIQCFGIELNKRRLANVLEFYHDSGLEVKKYATLR